MDRRSDSSILDADPWGDHDSLPPVLPIPDATVDAVAADVARLLTAQGVGRDAPPRTLGPLVRRAVELALLCASLRRVPLFRPVAVPVRADPAECPAGIAGRARVPHNAGSDLYAPLERAVSLAADDAMMDPHRMAWAATRLLERVADEVASGNRVVVPGFGAFAAVWYDTGRGPRGYAQVRFTPARTFRRQADLQCPQGLAELNGSRMASYRRSHHHSSGRPGRVGTVSSAMRRLRAGLRRDAPGALCDVAEIDGSTWS